jgi:hypothetical protein
MLPLAVTLLLVSHADLDVMVRHYAQRIAGVRLAQVKPWCCEMPRSVAGGMAVAFVADAGGGAFTVYYNAGWLRQAPLWQAREIAIHEALHMALDPRTPAKNNEEMKRREDVVTAATEKWLLSLRREARAANKHARRARR